MSFANRIVSIVPVAGQAAPVNAVTGAVLAATGGTLTNVDKGGGVRAWRTSGGYVDLAWPTGRAVILSNTTPDAITIAMFASESVAPTVFTSYLRLLQVGESANPNSSGIGIQRRLVNTVNCAWIDFQSDNVAADFTQRRAYVAQMSANEGGASADIARLWAGGLTGTPDQNTGTVSRTGTSLLNNIRIGMTDGGQMDYERVEVWLGTAGPTQAECDALRACTSVAQWDALLAGTDVIAPTLSAPGGVGGTLSAALTVTTNEATGTLYYKVSTTATVTVPAQGQPMTGWASQPVTAAGLQNINATGLPAGQGYPQFVHDDGVGNRSALASGGAITVGAGAAVYSIALGRMAHNTGAGRKVSTTFSGSIVWGGDFNDLQGKTITPIGATAVDAQGDCTLSNLPQSGPALVLRKWADGKYSAELATAV